MPLLNIVKETRWEVNPLILMECTVTSNPSLPSHPIPPARPTMESREAPGEGPRMYRRPRAQDQIKHCLIYDATISAIIMISLVITCPHYRRASNCVC